MDYILPNPFEYVDQPTLEYDCELSTIASQILENHSHPLPHDLLLIKDPPSHQNKLDPGHGHFMSQPKRKSITTFGEVVDDGDQEEGKKVKKMMHRDIERQRRQEMTTLYASLRSHVPLQYLKGKRSVSDHAHQAANYIKHLQKKVEELRGKKDGLMKKECKISGGSDSSTAVVAENVHSSSMMGDSVILVRPAVSKGVELVVNTPLKQGLPLSRVIGILLAQGLSTVSCNSAKRNQRLIYTLESEVIDGQSIDDIPQLRNRLNDVFGSSKAGFN